jgi:integrase
MYLVKRHQTYWALHDVPKALHGKLGRRLAKSLGTDNKLEAERKASLVWLHTPDVASKWIAGLGKEASAKTIGRILSFLRGYWKYLRAQGVLKADPFAGLSPPSTARRRTSWVPFTPPQVIDLRKRAAANGDHELVDLITLSMWSGTRIEELCSLEIPNVDLKGNAFKVVDAKTEAGLREVPIHPKVLPTFQRLIGKRKAGYILADLSSNKFGDRSNAIGKRFGRLKAAAGYGDGHVFHSIRKTVVTLLENAGVSENVAADIVGHEKPRITYGLYSAGASLEVKRAALAKLRYPPTVVDKKASNG